MNEYDFMDLYTISCEEYYDEYSPGYEGGIPNEYDNFVNEEFN